MEHKHTNHSTTRETMKAGEMKKQEISKYNIKHVIAVVVGLEHIQTCQQLSKVQQVFPPPLGSLCQLSCQVVRRWFAVYHRLLLCPVDQLC